MGQTEDYRECWSGSFACPDDGPVDCGAIPSRATASREACQPQPDLVLYSRTAKEPGPVKENVQKKRIFD